MIKTKEVIAYEDDDSITIRHTAKKLGVLVSKIPDTKLDEFFESLMAETVFMTDERRGLLYNKLSNLSDSISITTKLREVKNET